MAYILAYDFLKTLYVSRNINKISDFLHEHCTWIGASNKEVMVDKESICAFFQDRFQSVQSCVLTNEKFEIVSQSKTQIVVMGSYFLKIVGLNKSEYAISQHCTIIFTKVDNAFKVLHLNTSNTAECNHLNPSLMSVGSDRSYDTLLRLLKEKNEIIQMLDSNPHCGLKGSIEDEKFTYYYVNEGLYRMLGYTYDEFMEMSKGNAVDLCYPPDLGKALADVDRCFSQSDEYSTEYRIRKKDGSLMWVIDSGRKYRDRFGNVKINSILMDITELKHSQISLRVERERYRIALENITDVMFEYDVVNDRILKYAKKDNIATNPLEEIEIAHYLNYLEREDYIHLDDVGELKELLVGKLGKNIIDVRLYKEDNTWRWIEIHCSYIYDGDEVIKCIGIWKDVTNEKNRMDQLISLSQRDALTKLFHLQAIQNDIQNVINKEDNCMMMIMDIDDFKYVNDSYGHLRGNDILLAVTDVLLKNCFDTKYVCRIGGDEFMIFFPSSLSEKALESANKILHEVDKMDVNGIHVSLSIGVTNAKRKETFQQVFANADRAMYKAKRNGRNQIVVTNV